MTNGLQEDLLREARSQQTRTIWLFWASATMLLLIGIMSIMLAASNYHTNYTISKKFASQERFNNRTLQNHLAIEKIQERSQPWK